MTFSPMTANQRADKLRRCDADLLWLWLEDRWVRARQILSDSEMQAAIVAAQRFDRPIVTGTGTEDPDPTFHAANRGTAADIRASQVLGAWHHELQVIREHIGFVCELVAETLGDETIPTESTRSPEPQRTVASCDRRITWLLSVPQNRLERAVFMLTDEELHELDASVDEATADAKALRDGRLFTDGGTKVPSVCSVLEAARRATRVDQHVEQPKPLPPEGCVSCRRAGHFSPICTDRYDAKSLCRMCGDFASGEGRLPPVAAIKHVARTGKRLTAKVVMEADRAEQRGKTA